MFVWFRFGYAEPNPETCIPDYELTHLNRDRHGGGVVIYVAGYLPFTISSSGPYFRMIPVSCSPGREENKKVKENHTPLTHCTIEPFVYNGFPTQSGEKL